MVIFYKKWKKYNEFQLTKNKMDLNNRKMTNHPPSPLYNNNKNFDWMGHPVFLEGSPQILWVGGKTNE